MWFPKLERGVNAQYRILSEKGYSGRIPIYVVSKGRSDKCTTSYHLSLLRVKHFVVVEPEDVPLYQERVANEYATILELDMNYKWDYDACDDLGNTKNKGVGGARNFCWEHSMKQGAKWHWVMDDNTPTGFYFSSNNRRIKCRTGEFFDIIQDFVERFDNIAIAGLNYYMFVTSNNLRPPFTTNTRIYSYLLIRNDIPYRWRGRYNEDTDLSLRVLKDGWVTIQFNAFLADKAYTQTVKGGNHEVFYSKEGTLPKSEMLEQLHPDCATVMWRFNRWHHYVDYSRFVQPLKYKDGIKMPKAEFNDYGLKIVKVEECDCLTETDNATDLMAKYRDDYEKADLKV